MQKRTLGLIATILLSSALLLSFHHKVIFNSNDYLFAGKGDALKTYYYFASHIKYDSSYTYSEAILYPYGENLLFPDFQPALVTIIKLISEIFPGVVNYSVGIINFLLITSFLVCAIFLYLILMEFNIDWRLAILFSVTIAMLSPQYDRLPGHLSMGYVSFFPITWYVFIRFFNSNRKLKWTLIVVLVNTLWFFTHPYLGILCTFFIFLSWIFKISFNKNSFERKFPGYIHALIQVFLPIILFQAFLFLTDIYPDKTRDPMGIFSSRANFYSVFLPHDRPLKPLLEKLINIGEQKWEGWAYIGMPTTIMLASLIVILIVLLIRKKYKRIGSFFPKEFSFFLFAAILILVYSMAFPYSLHSNFIDKLFQPIKVFRALGRFAWVFYYVITVYFAVIICKKYLHNKAGKLNIIVLIIVLIINIGYFLESKTYHKYLSRKLNATPNLFIEKNIGPDIAEMIKSIDKDEYQAILPLPFTLAGNDNFGVDGTVLSKRQSLLLSYHTGLPMLGAISVRTSISNSKKTMQLFSQYNAEKPIINDMPNGKPLLVLYSNEPLSKNQKWIIDKAHLIKADKNFSLYKVFPDSLESVNTEALYHSICQDPRAFVLDSILIKDTTCYFYFDDFDEDETKIAYYGKGSFTGARNTKESIFKIPAGKIPPEQEYILSLWYYNKGINKTSNNIILEQSDGENLYWDYVTMISNSEVIDDDWSLVEIPFKVRGEKFSINVFLDKIKTAKDSFYIDNLMIRRSDIYVYSIIKDVEGQDSTLFYNNQHISF